MLHAGENPIVSSHVLTPKPNISPFQHTVMKNEKIIGTPNLLLFEDMYRNLKMDSEVSKKL